MWHGANRAARKGKWLGGIVPYGYRVNADRFLEINDDPLPGKEDMSEASVIRLLYYLVSKQKYSTIKVADYMNALSIPPSYVKDERQVKKGKRKENTAGIWRPGRIRNMLVNPTYKGIHIYGKRTKKDRELIEREVPAIVPKEDWDEAQQALRDNQLESMRNSTRNYLLRGLIKCGVCGLTYHGTAYNGPNRQSKAYYVCGGKTAYKGPLQGKCCSRNVPAEWLEDKVWRECVEFIQYPGEALKEVAAGMEEMKSQKEALLIEKQLAQKALLDKDTDRQAILDLFRKRIISAADVERQLQAIANERLSLEKRSQSLDDLLQNEDNLKNRFDTAEALLMDLRQKIEGDPPFEIRREIIRTLVKEIIIESPQGPEGTKTRKLQAGIIVRYSFNESKGVSRTLAPADISARSPP